MSSKQKILNFLEDYCEAKLSLENLTMTLIKLNLADYYVNLHISEFMNTHYIEWHKKHKLGACNDGNNK